MNPELIKILLPLAVELYKAYRSYYDGLSEEERAELLAAAKESFEKAGMASDVNE